MVIYIPCINKHPKCTSTSRLYQSSQVMFTMESVLQQSQPKVFMPQALLKPEISFYLSAVPTQLLTWSHRDSHWRTDLSKALEKNKVLSQLISQCSLVQQVMGEGWTHLNCICAEKFIPVSGSLGFHRVVRNIPKGSPDLVLASAELMGRDLER